MVRAFGCLKADEVLPKKGGGGEEAFLPSSSLLFLAGRGPSWPVHRGPPEDGQACAAG